MNKIAIYAALLMLAFLGTSHYIYAQKDAVEGHWLNEEKDAKIEVYIAKNGKYYGKLVWLKEPNRNGKPKLDEKNPKTELKSRALMDLVILKGFIKKGNVYDDGTIYDPKSGKTYSCTMTLKGNNLAIRGYVGVSLLGRTSTWSRSN